MERDNFEEQLSTIVTQADQKDGKPNRRENVWANIETRTNTKKRWYYAAAVILIMGFSIGMLLNRETNTISIKQSPIVVLKKVQVPRKPELVTPTEKGIKKDHFKIARTLQKTNDKVFEEEYLKKEPAKEPATSTVLAQTSPVEKEITPINPTIASPIKEEFTVQFKRGSAALVKEEHPIFTAFRKFRLRRDTNIYMANTVEKQASKIKLSFKKEN